MAVNLFYPYGRVTSTWKKSGNDFIIFLNNNDIDKSLGNIMKPKDIPFECRVPRNSKKR